MEEPEDCFCMSRCDPNSGRGCLRQSSRHISVAFMPLKKKASKKKDDTPERPPFMYEPPVMTDSVTQWVTVNFKLVTWGYLNFSDHVPTSTSLLALSDRIVKRHGGGIGNLKIYVQQVHPRNVAKDLTKSLADYGVMGGEYQGGKTCSVYYDYDPEKQDCPLVINQIYSKRFPETSEAMHALGSLNTRQQQLPPKPVPLQH